MSLLDPDERHRCIDIGHDHYMMYTSWNPDRELNPQYAGLPDVERVGAIIYHKNWECTSHIFFDGEVTQKLWPDHSRWKVESVEPLTVSPSIICRTCGDHGFIRDGKWIPA